MKQPLCPTCGSQERVSRITTAQSVIKCGRCGKIHQLLLHPGGRPDSAQLREGSGLLVQEAGRATVHLYVSAMLAFFAIAAVWLFVQLL